MANISRYDIQLKQGDDYTLPIQLNNSDGSPVQLSGKTIKAQIKRTKEESEALAEFSVTTDGANGKITLTLTSAQTQALVGLGNCCWDLRIRSSPTEVRTYLEGLIQTKRTVTQL